MAVIEVSVAGGNANETTSYVGGVLPGTGDDVVCGENSGNLTVTLEVAWRSVIQVAAYKNKLTANAPIRLGGGKADGIVMRVFAGHFTVAAGQSINFAVGAVANKLFTGGVAIAGNWIIEASAGSTIFCEEALNTTGEVKLLAGQLVLTPTTHEWGSFSGTGVSERRLNIEGSTIRLTATGTVWGCATITKFTMEAATAIIEVVDSKVTVKTITPGTGFVYGTLILPGGAENPKVKIAQTCTFSVIRFAKGVKSQLEVTKGIVITFTEMLGHGAAGSLITIFSATAASPFTFKSTLANVTSLDFVSLKDCRIEGGGKYYAGANSTNVSGNEGWTFTAAKWEGSFSATQAQSPTVARSLPEREFPTVSQAQSVEVSRTPIRNIVSAGQEQGVGVKRALGRSLSSSDGQSPNVARALSRVLSASQSSTVPGAGALPRAISRHLSVTQGANAAVARELARVMSASSPSSPTASRVMTKNLIATQVTSPAIVRLLSRGLEIVQASSPTLERVKLYLRAKVVTQASSISRRVAIARALGLEQGQGISLTRALARKLSQGQGQSPNVERALARHLSATQSSIVLAIVKGRSLSASLSATQGSSAGVTQLRQRHFSASCHTAISLERPVAVTLRAAQPSTAALRRAHLRGLTSTQESAVSYERRIGKPIPAVQGSEASVLKRMTRLLEATQSQTAEVEGHLNIETTPAGISAAVSSRGMSSASVTTTGVTASARADTIRPVLTEGIESKVTPVGVESGVS